MSANLAKQVCDESNSHDPNPFFSREYAKYFLDNWFCLLSLWTSLHLGDQGRGKSNVYHLWSQTFSDRECIKS